MLARQRLLDRDGITIDDVACRHDAGRGREIEPGHGHALVLVRRGCFIRRTQHGSELLDPTVAYCLNPGDEQRYDHPSHGGDDCTAIGLDAATATALWGGERLPTSPLPTPPQIDLRHRQLLAAAGREGDPDELYEHALMLTAGVLAQRDSARVEAGRPATRRARRRLVDDAREALVTDPGRRLPELAHDLGASPNHLSRLFHAHTGHTISRYRLLLRARNAREQIAAGERDLARLAADLGFADQSHLCRVIRSQTGRTPTALREAIA